MSMCAIAGPKRSSPRPTSPKNRSGPALRRGGVLGAVMVSLLAFAPSAFAGTIRYAVPESPDYTVKDNGQGIVKLNYTRCLTSGERQTVSFKMSATATRGGGAATFKVLKEGGDDPSSSFNPASVELTQGREQTIDVSLSFSLPRPNRGVTAFRIKLDPESGEGLGEGAGIMVRIACVLAAPPPGTPPSGAPGTGKPPVLSEPTAGLLPPTDSPTARREAPCVALPRRIRVHARELSIVRVQVAHNGQGIANSLVRISGPGFAQQMLTDSAGRAVFRVRARRTGNLVVQSDVCFGADRLRVRPAHRSRTKRPPRYTG